MKKLIMRMYGVAGILFFFLFLYGLFNLRIVTDRVNGLNGFSEPINLSVSTAADASAPIEEKKIIRFRLKDIHDDYDTLFFLTKYQDVKVFVDEELIYEAKARARMFAPKTTGTLFHDITLSREYNNKEIRIELIPYFSQFNAVPSLRVGAKNEILRDIIVSNLPLLILCAVTVAIGIVQLVVAFVNRERKDFGLQPAVCHAISIMMIGVWKMLDSEVAALFGRDFPAVAEISFLIFMSLPLMMNKMIRDQFEEENGRAIRVADAVAMVGMVALIVLRITGIGEFWQNLWIVLGSIIISFLCIGISLLKSVQKSGWTQNNRIACIVTCFALVWMAVDLMSNYLTGGVTAAPFSMLLFLVLVVILVLNRIQISRKGMEEGMQAMQYQKLAFHDALTGFFNRAAYMDYISGSEFDRERSIMLVFDLNNLKKCNDELGHEKGDIYIKESAKIIMDCFGEKGRCYRLGGDEFSVILVGSGTDDCEERIQRMKSRVEKFNHMSRDIHMGIACGYAVFDPQEDEDIHATVRRADKMMYEMKFEMKRQANT